MTYDDRGLMQLWAELDPKHRKKAIRGALRKEANRVRKVARQELASAMGARGAAVGKGIQTIIYAKNSLGFRVTAQPHGKKYMHMNRFGKLKPVAFWANVGTAKRHTRQRAGRMAGYRGSFKGFAYMKSTAQRVDASVAQNLKDAIVDKVKSTAKKYGCKV